MFCIFFAVDLFGSNKSEDMVFRHVRLVAQIFVFWGWWWDRTFVWALALILFHLQKQKFTINDSYESTEAANLPYETLAFIIAEEGLFL